MKQLAVAQQIYQQELAQKAALELQLADALARRENLGSTPVLIAAFLTEQDFITGTKQRIIQSQQAISRASRGVEKGLRAYLQARRQAKMMESLYDKDYAEFRREKARKEQRIAEDLATMRARFVSGQEEGEVA